jgi:hypothetical protein
LKTEDGRLKKKMKMKIEDEVELDADEEKIAPRRCPAQKTPMIFFGAPIERAFMAQLPAIASFRNGKRRRFTSPRRIHDPSKFGSSKGDHVIAGLQIDGDDADGEDADGADGVMVIM